MLWSWRNWLKRTFFVHQENRAARRNKRRTAAVQLALEELEGRIVPAPAAATPFYVRGTPQPGIITPFGPFGPGGGYTAAAVEAAYGVNQLWSYNSSTQTLSGNAGAGETIAVVDAYDDPAFVSSSSPQFNVSDLHYFDQYFGLPDPTFVKVNQNGVQGSYPTVDPNDDWEGEESLDVEWAHAMAPAAKIILVECDNPDTLFTGVDWAAKPASSGGGGASVVSMSFGTAGGYPGETAYDRYFSPTTYPGVTFLASADDQGSNLPPSGTGTYQAAYPADSPNVIAVGGTALNLNSTTGAYINETVWNDGGGEATGGGISNFESQPSYQNPATNAFSTTKRSAPDVAMIADPQTGVDVYDSYDGTGALGSFSTTNFSPVGGTSLSSPCWGGLVAIADQIRTDAGQANYTGETQTLPRLYAMYESSSYSADFNDVTVGSNGSYSAGVGYDLCTGIGTPKANNMVPDLANINSLTYAAPSGTNNFVLEMVGTNLELLDNGTLEVYGTASSITSVTITGGTNNTLTINYGGGVFTANVSFSGGSGSGTRTVTIQGNSTAFASETYTPSGAAAGTITIGSQVITYTNVSAVDDVALATTFTVDGTTSADQLNIVNGTTVNSTQTTQVNSGNNTFAPLNFANKTTVTVNGLTGGDTFTVNNPAPALGLTTLDVDSGATSGVTFNVLTTPAGVTTNVLGGGGSVTVNVGNSGSVQGILGALTLDNSSGPHSAITVDDSADTSARSFTLASGQIQGLAPVIITYVAADTQSLTVKGGSGGNTITVNSATTGIVTTLLAGNGSDNVTVNPLATGTDLVVNGQLPYPSSGNTLTYNGFGTVNPGAAGSGTITQSGQGTITFSNFSSVNLPASVSNSYVTINPSTITSGGTALVTLQTEDSYGNNLTSGGLTVTFGLGAGNATGSFSSVTDNGNGTYTATFTGILAGTNTITATMDGAAVTHAAPSFTVVPGALSLAQSTVSVASATDASGTTDLVTLTARDSNGNQLTTGGLAVAIGLGAGSSTGSLSAVTDNGNGTYTATFTGILVGSARTITGTINGAAVGTTLPAITVIPGAVSLANSLLTVASATDASGATDLVTLTTYDAAGNALTTGGLSVNIGLGVGTSTGSLSGFTDDNDGVYTETFTGNLVGTARTITATIGGNSVTSTLPTITVTPGAVSLTQSTYSVAPTSVLSGATATVTLTARDAAGNLETAGGLTVVFGLGAGSSTGSLSSAAYQGSGVYTATFTGGLVGTARTITATIGGSSVTSTAPTITVTPGVFSLAQSTVTVAQPTLTSYSVEQVTLTARDAAGNPEPTGGLSVAFGLGAGTSTGILSAATDNGNGTYTATFTGILAGSPTAITATINGGTVTSTPPTITVTPGAFSLATSTVAVAQSSILSGNTDVVTLTARDAAGNQLTTGGLLVSFGVGAGTSTGSLSSVTDHSDGAYTATFTGILAGTPRTITGSIAGSAVTSALPTITVTPGAISLSQSTVSVVPASIQSGSSAVVTLTARDAAGNQETGGGASVAFGLGAGTSTGTLSAVTDNGNGTYTATFTGVLVGTARTITANIGGSSLTAAFPTITVTPGAASLANSTLTVAQPTIASGNTDLVLLTTRDAAGNLEASGGLSVAFNLGAGSSTGTLSAVSDLGNGTYSALFTGVLVGTPRTITATIGGNALTSTLPTIAVTPGAISLATSTVSVVPSSIQAGSTATITLTARDAAGNAETMGGQSVVFGLGAGTSSGTLSAFQDNGNGTYSETFTGTLAGTPRTITATLGSNPITSALPAITVTAGAVSLANSFVTDVPATIPAGTTTALTLITEDAYGNLETTGGQTVAFVLGGGTAGGTIGSVIDNHNGTYSATFTSDSDVGTNTFTATIGGSAITSAPANLTVIPAAFDLATSTITIVPATVASGSAATVTMTARDAYGNQEPTGGLIVTFGLAGGTASGSFGSTIDNGNGSYTAQFNGILAGANAITAFIGGAQITSGNPAVTVVPGPVSLAQSTISIAPSSIVSSGTATITLTARDAAGNPETGGGLGVTFGFGVGTSSGTIGPVTDHLNGTYTATFTGTTAGTPRTITAAIGGNPLTSAYPAITVTPGAVSLSQSTISITPGTIQSGATSIVTLTTRDAQGNQETTGGLTVAFALGAGSATGAFSGLTDNGNGTYSAVFTGILAGSNTVTATINSQSLTSSSPAIVVTPGPFSLAQSTVAIVPGSVQSGSNAAVTLIARDAAGNQETSGGLTVNFGLGLGGTASGNFSSVADNHNGTYTASFTGIASGVGTITATLNGQSLTSALPTITVTPGPFSLAESTVSIAPASIQSGSSTTITLVARDVNGNQETSGGLAVNFGLGGGSATGSFGPVTDNGNGTYTGSFTGFLAGNNSITATINSQALTSGFPAMVVTPGTFSLAQSTVTVTPGSIQSGSTATVTLTARDAAGNQETAGGLTVAFSLGAGTATGSFGAVTDLHNGTYQASFTGVLAGAGTIVGSINAQPLTSTAPAITVTPGAFSLAGSTLVATPASIQSGSAATLTLTARDAAGNQEPAGGLIVTFGFGGGTSTGTLSAVTDNGNGTYTGTFTGILVGTARTITAAINGNAITSSLPSVTVTPGAFSLAQSTVGVAPTSIPSGGAAALTLTARDAAGNLETTGGLNVGFSLGAGSATGTISPVTDNGNGTYTASFVGQLAGTRAIVGAINSQSLTSSAPVVTVAPGSYSLANSTISVAPSSIASGSTTTVTLTVRDAAGNQETTGGLSVAFGIVQGNGALSNFTDNHNGTYSATFTGESATTDKVSAAIAGSYITSALPSITVTPGAFSVSQSSVTIAPASISSGSTAIVTLTARDADGNRETAGGLAVNFGLGVGAANGTFGVVTDNTNGTYSAVFTGILVGVNTITATMNGQTVTSSAPTITVTPGAASASQSTIAIAPASIQSGGTAVVTLTTRDAAGNLETSGGLSVGFGLGAGSATGSFTGLTDNHNGTYSATFTGVLAGVNTVTATINSQAVTSAAPSVTVTPGPFSLAQSTVSIAPASIQSGTTATVTLTARDAAGNPETTGGLTVTFGLGGGAASGTFTAVTDESDGLYVATLTGVLAGTNTITAKINALSVTSTQPTFTVTPGPISLSQSTLAVAPGSIQSGSAAAVTLTARDAAGNLESAGGAAVAFNISGSATGNFSTVTDNHNGTYTASFTGGLVGTGTITATIDTLGLTSSPPAITVTPGPVSLSQSNVTIVPGTIQSGNTATITLLALDADGNVESSGGLNVAFNLGVGSATGVIGPVTDHHNGDYTAIFTGILAGTNTISATINGVAVTSVAPTVTVTPAPFSLAQSVVTITPASIQSGGAATITLTARDAAGNQESSGGLNVAFALGFGSATGTIGPVTDQNNGTYTATFTGILAGTNTVSASINSQALASAAPTLNVTPGPFDLSQSTVTIAPGSIASGSTSLVTLTARDAAGNQESSGGLSAGFTLGGGTATGTFSAVIDHNDGVYTASFTGLLAGTNSVKASLNAQTLTAAAPITVTPGPFNLMQSAVSIAPASVPSGSSAVLTLTVRDTGGDQESTGGLLVNFTFGAGSATGSVSAVSDNHNGTYSAVFTGIAAGTRAISATIDGQALVSTPATITVTPEAVSLSQSTVSVAPGSIQAGASATVTLTARDPNGNLETAGGLAVSFSLQGGSATGTFGPVTDHHNGTYTASFTGNLAGTSFICGAIGGQAVTTTAPSIVVTPGAISAAGSTLTVTPASLPIGGLTTVTLTTADAYGNRETAGGANVAFALGAGNIGGTFGAVADNDDGTYSATFAAGTTAGSGLVTATINGQPVTSTAPTLTLTAGPVSLTQSVVMISPATIPAGGSTTVTLTTRDAFGNAETTGGLSVSFGLAAGAATGSFSNVIDHGDGVYSATFTAGANVGANTVTATINGQFVVSLAPTVAVVAGPVSLSRSIVSVTPASVSVGGTATITLTALDALGNQETGGGLSVAFSLGAGASVGAISGFTDNQNGTYTATFTGALAGANTITATIGGHHVTSAAPSITVTAGPTTTTLSASPAAGAVFGEPVTLSAVVAPVVPGFGAPTGSVSFYENGSFVGSGSVNGSGLATFTTTHLPALAQTLTDTYSGDANFASSSGELDNYAVSPADTAVTLTASPASGDVFGQSVTLTASLLATGGSPATVNGGTVDFYDGSAYLGTSGSVVGGLATLATAALPVDPSNTITAVYSGSANFNGATGALANYAVAPAGTSIAIASAAPVSGLGQAVTFTATLGSASSAVISSGAVSFYDGSVTPADLLGTSSTVSADQATFTTAALSRGTHSIIAVYADTLGDFDSSTSGPITQTVIGADLVKVTSSPSAPVFGQPVTFSITVAGTGGTPSGSIAILQGGTSLASATLASGTCTITLSSLAAGPNALVVTYGGDSVFAPNNANFAQQVNAAATTTNLSPTASSVFGQAVTFTATVSVKSPGAGSLAGGAVNFKDGATLLGTGIVNAAGVATFTTTNTQLAAGAHSITAAYVVTAEFAASVSAARAQSVAAAGTKTTLATSAPGGSIFTQSVTFTATVAASGNSTATPTGGTVSFYNGAASPANLLGTAALVGGVASFSTARLAVAPHTISAVYSGASGFAASTGTAAQSVLAAGTTTTLSSSLSAGAAFGQAITFTAAVAVVSPGTGQPTGTVRFYDGATLLGSAPLTAAGFATLSTASLAANPAHAITAVYAGSSDYGGSQSSVLDQAVNPAATSVTLVSSASTLTTGQAITFSAAVQANSGGPATGSVTFVIDGGAQSFTVNLAKGAATLKFAGFMTAGFHTVQAVYNPAANFANASSNSVSVRAFAASSVALTSSSATIVTGNPVTISAAVAGTAGIATGSISFYDGTRLLGTVAVNGAGVASITLSNLSIGTHNITATYSGDSVYAAAASNLLHQVISPAPNGRLE